MNNFKALLVITALTAVCTATSANACYKHTFEKCDGTVQVADANAAAGQQAKGAAPQSAQGASASGWVTTVVVNR